MMSKIFTQKNLEININQDGDLKMITELKDVKKVRKNIGIKPVVCSYFDKSPKYTNKVGLFCFKTASLLCVILVIVHLIIVYGG